MRYAFSGCSGRQLFELNYYLKKIMKKHSLLFVIGFSFLATTLTFAQGSLTPPGAPAQTMKSLDQVQPRTPIAYSGYGIFMPGSYYLTTNIVGFSGVNGINITCDNVTIDLNGFTLQGVSGSLSGINISGANTNIIVRNGIITGWGSDGIDGGFSSQNLILEHLTLSANVVNGVEGNNCIVSGCSVQNNQFDGITIVGSGSQIIGNTLFGNNSANHSNGSGILIEGNNNRIEDNHVTASSSSGYGIAVFSGTANIIIKNSVEGGGANNYSIPGGNDVGPIGTATNSTSAWANISH